MKKILFIAACAAILPLAAAAQVEKQVEVTKAYVPSVESASKLAVVPDMTDTVRMRPEIDYSISPLSLETNLATRPIRPATVTYWEFNRPQPFYLKAGVGYPFNSVLDFYASSQNPGTGYVVGYLNHEGRFADICNDFGEKKNSTRMFNRIGAAAGKYLGKQTLEGNLSYDNRLYHRYGSRYLDEPAAEFWSGLKDRILYHDLSGTVRFGDDFKDLSRLNFEIALRGGYFTNTVPNDSSTDDYSLHQVHIGTGAKLARQFGRHRFAFEVSYDTWSGKYIDDKINQQQARIGLRYGIDGGVVRLDAGADYVYDKLSTANAGNYIIPHLRVALNLGTKVIQPFIEADGGVRENSYRSLTLQNPYIDNSGWERSSVDYNVRGGLGGTLGKDKFDYRLFAAFSVRDYHLYWYTPYFADVTSDMKPVYFTPKAARQTVTSFQAQMTYRPLNRLHLSLDLGGFLYNDDTILENGEAGFKANFKARYEGRKISFGVSADLQSARKWSGLSLSLDEGPYYAPFEVPFAVDLGVDFEWRVNHRLAIFAEGRNLANRRLYRYAWFPEYGANCTVGVKLVF